MSVGKNPHRPEGKADTDNPHMQAVWQKKGPAYMGNPSEKEVHQEDMETLDRVGGEGRYGPPEDAKVGGSRPGVPSRVKEAIQHRNEREAEEANEENE